jgi:hypothetical protein
MLIVRLLIENNADDQAPLDTICLNLT